MRARVELTFNGLGNEQAGETLQAELRADRTLDALDVTCNIEEGERLRICVLVRSPPGLPRGARRDGWLPRMWKATEPVDRAFDAVYDAVTALGWSPRDLARVAVEVYNDENDDADDAPPLRAV